MTLPHNQLVKNEPENPQNPGNGPEQPRRDKDRRSTFLLRRRRRNPHRNDETIYDAFDNIHNRLLLFQEIHPPHLQQQSILAATCLFLLQISMIETATEN
jgi:hypothetical protein